MVTYRDPIYASWKTVDSDFARSRVARYAKRPAVELFDLRADPWCLRNLADDSRLPRNRVFSSLGQVDEAAETRGRHGRLAKSRQPRSGLGRKRIYTSQKD